VGKRHGTPLGALWENLAVLRGAAASERRALEPLLDASGPDRLVTSVPLLDEDVHDLDTLGAVAGILVSD